MFKAYVKINGVWVRVFMTDGWYEAFCWVCAGCLVGAVGLLIRNNVL